ncbi:hypothetical protein F3Y22_tig00110482pilonHSYRG00318 [Hibiscus syriacus]|uniref:Uncharacterized protein n=1 Tax=Hibiscus syriacus TaxID=106335 RepID=A0A6A3ADE8_HIBSY|nr:hypothetical protein F3Y22_tig00110482pilonHSYRG00318 [Hibiscus syriacus]
MGSSKRQLKAMLRKNWLLKIRHPYITAAEILLPTVVILLLIGIRTRVDTQIHPAQPYIRKDMFVEVGKGISPNFQQVLELLLAKREYLAFAPDTEQTRQMINLISIKFPLLQLVSKIYKDELELDTYIQSDLYDTCDFSNCSNPKIKGAVVFHHQGPQLFDYSIRLNHTWAFSGFPDVKTIMDTNGPYLNDLELGVNILSTMQYSFSGFLTLQQVLDSFIIFAAQQTETGISSQNIELTPLRSTNVTSSPGLPWTQFSPSNIRIAPFPTREYTDDEFQSIIKSVLGLLYLLGFLYPISRLISYTVFEKEQKIREGLFMMGLKDGIFHLSWFITYAFQHTVMVGGEEEERRNEEDLGIEERGLGIEESNLGIEIRKGSEARGSHVSHLSDGLEQTKEYQTRWSGPIKMAQYLQHQKKDKKQLVKHSVMGVTKTNQNMAETDFSVLQKQIEDLAALVKQGQDDSNPPKWWKKQESRLNTLESKLETNQRYVEQILQILKDKKCEQKQMNGDCFTQLQEQISSENKQVNIPNLPKTDGKKPMLVTGMNESRFSYKISESEILKSKPAHGDSINEFTAKDIRILHNRGHKLFEKMSKLTFQHWIDHGSNDKMLRQVFTGGVDKFIKCEFNVEGINLYMNRTKKWIRLEFAQQLQNQMEIPDALRKRIVPYYDTRWRMDHYKTQILQCQKSATEHSFKAVLTSLSKPGGGEFGRFYSLPALNDPRIDKLPYSIRILLEYAVRNCENFHDFTGVLAEVDLAYIVIDHSIQVDVTRSENAVQANMELEFQSNKERFFFLKLGSTGFHKMLVVPPGSSIVHQVNLEYIGPDNVVGIDSHTTMIDGLGVAGWGVGGIEAEAAMLGQPMSMVLLGVVGLKLFGKLRNGVTSTNLIITVTQILRKHGVVGKFVEFYGDKLEYLNVTDFQLLKEVVDLDIRIQIDKDSGIITIIDSGLGMIKQELVDCLGTIKQGGTAKFLKAVKENKDVGTNNNLISQFGVDFYSAYLVSDKVVVSTKSPKSYVREGEVNESSYSIWEETTPEWPQKLVKNYSQIVSFQIYTWQEKGINKEVKVDGDPVEAKKSGQDENIEKKKKTKKVVENYGDWELTNETQPIGNMLTHLLDYVGVLRRNIMDLRIYSRVEEYFSGYEGSTLLSWYREIIDRKFILVNVVNAKTYEVTVADYNSRFLFGYTSVRLDLVVGELRMFEPIGNFFLKLQLVEIIALIGREIEGAELTVVAVILTVETQQWVWGKYKKYVGSKFGSIKLPIQGPCLAIGFLPLHFDDIRVGQLVTLKRRNERLKDIRKSIVSQNNDAVLYEVSVNPDKPPTLLWCLELTVYKLYRQTSIALRRKLKLAVKFYGPYGILEKIGTIAYRLDLPDSSRLHPVFHVSLLKKFIGDSSTAVTKPPTVDEKGLLQIKPLKIMGRRIVNKNGKTVTQLLGRWENLDEEYDTGEDYSTLKGQFTAFDPWGQGSSRGVGIVMVGGEEEERRNEEDLGIEERGLGIEESNLGIEIRKGSEARGSHVSHLSDGLEQTKEYQTRWSGPIKMAQYLQHQKKDKKQLVKHSVSTECQLELLDFPY